MCNGDSTTVGIGRIKCPVKHKITFGFRLYRFTIVGNIFQRFRTITHIQMNYI